MTDTSTQLTTQNLDLNIVKAAQELEVLAASADAKLAAKIKTLAGFTQPSTKGMEGKQRITIPQIYIRQPISASEAMPQDTKVGELFSIDGAIGPSVTILPILYHDVRRKWMDSGVDCASLDAITGSKYGSCDVCPHGRFEKDVRPECSKGVSIYGVSEDLSALYKIEFMKSSAKAGRNIQKLSRPPALWARSFQISTEKKSANNRNYYEFKTQSTGQKTSDDVMKVCDSLHIFFKALYDKALASQLAYRMRQQSGDTSPAPDAVVVDTEGDVIDFSESL